MPRTGADPNVTAPNKSLIPRRYIAVSRLDVAAWLSD